MFTDDIIVIGSFLVILVGMVTIYKGKDDGYGADTLRALGLVVFLPILLISATLTLGLEGSAFAALLGVVAGYIFARCEAK